MPGTTLGKPLEFLRPGRDTFYLLCIFPVLSRLSVFILHIARVLNSLSHHGRANELRW